jgi:hypothetical protein
MGTGGILAAQALALKINQGFSEVFVTPATGFSGLSFVNMEGVQLNGSQLTPAQASALNGQATLQVREAADRALGGGPLPYGLSFGQLTDLIDLVNASFESCGPSGFAQTHLYQPYVTSNAFTGRRPSTVSTFAVKPTYNTFQGDLVPVGLGCTSASYTGFPADKIALIERGGMHLLRQGHRGERGARERGDHLQQCTVDGMPSGADTRREQLRSAGRHGRCRRVGRAPDSRRLRPAIDRGGAARPHRGDGLRPAVT